MNNYRMHDFLPNGYRDITDLPWGEGITPTIETFSQHDRLKIFLSDTKLDFGQTPPETLFHIMSLARNCFPFEYSFTPSASITLACLLAQKMHNQDTLALYAWDLLPVAVLLTIKFPRLHILLPTHIGKISSYPTFDYWAIVGLLQRVLPDTQWSVSSMKDYQIDGKTHMLGLNPFWLFKYVNLSVEQITTAKSTLFYLFWNRLRGEKYREYRQQCVDANIIRTVIQLPAARRTGQPDKLAIMILGKPENDEKTVRMVKIGACKPGPMGINPDTIVELATSPADATSDCKDIQNTALTDDLTPAFHLIPNKIDAYPAQLGEFADILRCQLPRKKVEDDGNGLRGQIGDRYYAREIRYQDLDPVSGFVPIDEVNDNLAGYKMDCNKETHSKYLLRQNDIVYAYRGSQSSIGGVGFVNEIDCPGIPGQIMCIIRVKHGIDPVWLYHYLRTDPVREWARSKSIGSGLMMTLGLSLVAQIPVRLPTADEINAVKVHHMKAAVAAWSIAQQKKNISQEFTAIDGLVVD